jgi:dolichol-phosphate mannosyltransferase
MHRNVISYGPQRSDGFKVLLEVLVHGSWTKAIEVPYALGRRERGHSKARSIEGVRFLRQVGRLRFRSTPKRSMTTASAPDRELQGRDV